MNRPVQATADCPECAAPRLVERPVPIHLVHGLISLFTVGLWLPVWLVLTMLAVAKPYRCQMCGTLLTRVETADGVSWESYES